MPDDEDPPMAKEPCDRCGDETAVGSPLYAGRHQDRPGDAAVLVRCGPCAAREVAGHEPPRDAVATDDWLPKSVAGANVRVQW